MMHAMIFTSALARQLDHLKPKQGTHLHAEIYI